MSTAKQKRRYYRDDPEKYRARARRWYRQNRAKALAKKAEWNATNKAEAAARCAAFRAANPNYFREYGQRKRVRDAWLQFTTTCASNRRAMEVT